MMLIAANGGSGKPYDWRDVTKVPRRNAGEEAKAEAAKAARESERAEADRDFAEAVAAGETLPSLRGTFSAVYLPHAG
jgi:hypothetical protein